MNIESINIGALDFDGAEDNRTLVHGSDIIEHLHEEIKRMFRMFRGVIAREIIGPFQILVLPGYTDLFTGVRQILTLTIEPKAATVIISTAERDSKPVAIVVDGEGVQEGRLPFQAVIALAVALPDIKRKIEAISDHAHRIFEYFRNLARVQKKLERRGWIRRRFRWLTSWL